MPDTAATSPDGLPLHCKKCGAKWRRLFHLPMEIGAWIKAIRRIHCPQCDASYSDVEIAS